MTRLLDIDLDFFVEDPAYMRASTDPRLDAIEHPVCATDSALKYLRDHCGLSSKLPGFVVEHHGEMFGRWLDAIERGQLVPPFSVTHLDAHADLGLGDSGYLYLLTELLFEPLEARMRPRAGVGGLADGNWLAFAVACRWLSDLTYVYNTEDDRPRDLAVTVMEGFDTNAANIQLAAVTARELEKLWQGGSPKPSALEPRIPFSWIRATEFATSQPFDIICLAKSPGFTPATADGLFGELCDQFIDTGAFG